MIWIAFATRPIRPIVSIAPPCCSAATAVYWARTPQAIDHRHAGRDQDDAGHRRAGEALDRDTGESEEDAGEHREHDPLRCGEAPRAMPDASATASRTSPPSKPAMAAGSNWEWLPLKPGAVSASSARPAPPRRQRQSTGAPDGWPKSLCDITARVTAPPARTACTSEIGAIESAATWTSQATAASAQPAANQREYPH